MYALNWWIIYSQITLILILSSFSLELVKPENSSDWLFPVQAAKIYTTTSRGTYFGYSVASYVGQSQPFCLVGAPQATQISDDFIGSPVAPNKIIKGEPTGLIYRLDLHHTYPDCSVMPVAYTNEERRQFGIPEPGVSLWTGGMVAATNGERDGLQLGCDPRYLYTPSMSNKSLPGMGMQNMGIGTCALYTGVSLEYTAVDPCVSGEEGTCLSGFSGAMESGSEPGEAFIALGMPGSYLTEGNVFFGHYLGKTTKTSVRLKSSPQDLKHKGFSLGYAVGLYRNQQWSQKSPDHFTVLASSPMWIENDYRGIVMVLTEALNLDSIEYINDVWGHVGSFFGYSLALVDLDGNGIPDIVVGAPYYTENHRLNDDNHQPMSDAPEPSPDENLTDEASFDRATESRNRLILPDVGRVYIFYGQRKRANNTDAEFFEESESNRVDYTNEPPLVLTGNKASNGRFGHALVSLGDLDGDGIDDLAVSCPFCPDRLQRMDVGAVFIYLGQKDAKIEDEPNQIVYPADLPNPISASCGAWRSGKPVRRRFTAFGWSLSAQNDLDENVTPDLVVGDYDSEQVVTLRSRNILWLENPRWEFPERPTLDWADPGMANCEQRCRYRVALFLDLRSHENFFKHQGVIRFRYRIDLDSKIDDLSAKRLNIVGQGVQSVLEREVAVPFSKLNKSYSVMHSRRFKLFDVFVEPKLKQTSEQLWKPVVINTSITLLSEPMPYLVDGGPDTVAWKFHPYRGERIFPSRKIFFSNPACGHDDICEPELQVEVKDTSEGHDDPSTIFFRERVHERNLTVFVRNLGENAYNAKVRVKIPGEFGYIAGNNLECKVEDDADNISGELDVLNCLPPTIVVCSLSNPFTFASSRWEKISFQLSTSGVFQFPSTKPTSGMVKEKNSDKISHSRSDWTPPDDLTVTAEITSDNENSHLVKSEFTYSLKLFSDLEISSSSVDKSVIDTRNFSSQFSERQRVHPERLGPEFKNIFLISNKGPSPMENIWVNLSVPIQTEEGHFLVYLLDMIRRPNPSGGPPLTVSVVPEVISADGHSRGLCYTPSSAINPIGLNAVNMIQLNEWNQELENIRNRRDIESSPRFFQDLNEDDSESESIQAADSNVIYMEERSHQQNVIECNRPLDELGLPQCVEIPCRIDKLGRGDAVRIILHGWVWADTMFRHKWSDIAVVITANVALPHQAFGLPVAGNFSFSPFSISQNFVFEGIKRLIKQPFPLIPVIIGVALGLIFLLLIIILMWWCGFFKRAKRSNSFDDVAQIPTDFSN